MLDFERSEFDIATPETPTRGRPRSFDRDEALETAMILFWQKGFEKTSLSDLVDSMGIRPASIYAAFQSKEALFSEVLTRYRNGVGSGLPRIVNAAPSAREAVKQVLEGTAAVVTRRTQPRGCMVVLSAMSGFTASPTVSREVKRCRSEDFKTIEKRLKQAVVSGELLKSCDPSALAAFYMAVLQGMSVQARDGASRAALMAIANQAMQAWPGKSG